MLPQCEDQGLSVIPWSPQARGRLTRDASSSRAQNDAFAQKMYENSEEHDRQVIESNASRKNTMFLVVISRPHGFGASL
jgi:aryl-alcohol dehydrogenase-like predicted oxidoreductase